MNEQRILNRARVTAWSVDALVIVALLASVAASLWQGQYTIDHVHWGLMLSNAQDLVGGRVPYRDIFIQYGFLTTVVHALAYAFAGENLQALIAVTATAYALGVWLVFVLAKHLTGDTALSLYACATFLLFHPITIYPWSNYLAFPFLMLGLYGVVLAPSTLAVLLTGVSFGLAVLMREGLAPSVILFLLGSILIDLRSPDRDIRGSLRRGALMILGALLPIAVFILYLVRQEIVSYWVGLSWSLPRIYMQIQFPHMSGIGLAKPLLQQITNGVLRLDVRWILIAAMLIANAATLLLFLLDRSARRVNPSSAKLALLSLVLISSALHLPEIFRIATGSAVGLINLYIVLKAVRLQHLAFAGLAVAMAITIAPADSGENFSSTNYFFPSTEVIASATPVHAPKYFRSQRWDAQAQQFYAAIENDLKDIARHCAVRYQYNYTYDVFLKVLSPFEQYQLAPFVTDSRMSALRRDFDVDAKIKDHRDLVIFQQTPNADVATFVPPPGFSVFRHYKTPRTNFLYGNNALLILIPTDCAASLAAR